MADSQTEWVPPKPIWTLSDGSIITIGQEAPTMTRLSTSTVVKVVEMFHPHGIYQKNDLDQWWKWRGRRGWVRVRKAETIQELEAVP